MQKKRKLYGKSRTIPVLKTELELCSWVVRGSMRKVVLLNIKKRVIPSEIVKHLAGEQRKSSSQYAQVSRALAELESQGLIKCLNPKEKTGRFYHLTRKGSDILKKL